MSKALLICLRDSTRTAEFADKASRLSARILPDNITPNPPAVAAEDGIVSAVYNPVSAVQMQGTSICLGKMLNPPDDWQQPGAAIPDGNYALYRSDSQQIELVTDIPASRTVWYIQTDDLFIASNSQRAIVALLGSFRFNANVLPWMLSNGALGPGNSWDERIRTLKGNSRLTLNRQTWQVSIVTESIPFIALPGSDAEHRARLRATLDSVFSQLDLDPARWMVTLSGGVDSRALFLLLKNRAQFRCAGFGLRESYDDPQSDIAIGRRVAEQGGAPYRFYETDMLPDMPMEERLRRFLVAGEGRNDHISMYMNGFRHWKALFEDGVEGVLCGDQNFGRPHALFTPLEARQRIRLTMLSDYPNLSMYPEFELPEQRLPDYLQMGRDEPLSRYGDRLYEDYFYPVVMSALNDLKTGYVEIINPFLVHSITRCLRSLPDHLRQSKHLIREIAGEMQPPVPLASRRAEQERSSIVRTPEAVALFRQELRSPTLQRLLSERLLRFLDDNLSSGAAPKRQQTRAWFTKYIPPRLLSRIRSGRVKMDYNAMALRACMISRMAQMLDEDARLFGA